MSNYEKENEINTEIKTKQETNTEIDIKLKKQSLAVMRAYTFSLRIGTIFMLILMLIYLWYILKY